MNSPDANEETKTPSFTKEVRISLHPPLKRGQGDFQTKTCAVMSARTGAARDARLYQ